MSGGAARERCSWRPPPAALSSAAAAAPLRRRQWQQARSLSLPLDPAVPPHCCGAKCKQETWSEGVTRQGPALAARGTKRHAVSGAVRTSRQARACESAHTRQRLHPAAPTG